MMHASVDLLHELVRPGWEDLARAFQTRVYVKSAPMFGPKEKRDAVFIVTEGRARGTRFIPDPTALAGAAGHQRSL
ncbi:MAG: hypothetical protein BWK76_02850 [Desulfobulbaceae bacterium A2]|nr:MAG: hypothetical protein BWK76_02850 [Desulfobulbaceae bacterium A2]